MIKTSNILLNIAICPRELQMALYPDWNPNTLIFKNDYDND